MAQMLRKSVLPKNISLLKCMKGRSFATTSRKNPAILSAALSFRSSKYKSYSVGHTKIKRAKQFSIPRSSVARSQKTSLHYCRSNPSLVLHSDNISVPMRSFSTGHFRSHISNDPKNRSIIPVCRNQLNSKYSSVRFYSKPCDACCPCPFPCGPCGCKCGCSCLPPPCNVPPRCIQYMTGYYYYPYGTWFCGPYHVQGTCVPVPRPGCVPCKCCPACICPMGVFDPTGMGKQQSPNPNVSNPPLYDPSRRSGLSKWLPNCIPRSPGFNPKSPIPPVISSIVCGGYGTQPNVTEESTETNDPYAPRRRFRSNTSALGSSYDPRKKSNVNPISHKRYKHYHQCPQLDKPRTILTKEERDHPNIKPDSFSFSTVPQFKNPYPRPYEDLEHT